MRMLHTMLRVNDLEQSIDFYTRLLGMSLLRKVDNDEYKYTLAFIGYGDESETTVLELTHNWGTSSYEHGSAFGHIAIEVDDLYQTCTEIKTGGGAISREPGPVLGGSTHIAFVKDPNGYAIELIGKKAAN